MTPKQLNSIRLLKMLANDLDVTKPNFRTTLDAIESYASAIKKDLGLDKPKNEMTGWKEN